MPIARIKHGKKIYRVNIPFSLEEMAFEDTAQYIGLYHQYLEAEDDNKERLIIDAVCSFDERFRNLDFGSYEDVKELREKNNVIELRKPLTIVRLFIHFEKRLVNAFVEYLDDILSILKIEYKDLKNIDDLKLDHHIKQNLKAALGGDLVNQYLAILELSQSVGHIGLENDLSIKVGEKKFYLLQSDVSKFFLDEVTGGEFVMVKEFRRLISLEANKKQIIGYDGYLDFKLGMNEVSTLLREKDAPLPIDEAQRAKFIKAQTKYFIDNRINARDVLNVRFFLTCCMLNSTMTNLYNHFGNPQHTTEILEMLPNDREEMSNKVKSANKYLIK